MRILYFDCFAGASGDMILGALVGAGVEERALLEGLASLSVEGYELSFEQVERSGIAATRALVRTGEEHHHRHLSDIRRIIEDSRLSGGVKERAGEIFLRLAEAEARVHNMAVERVHFHEVGALDAIVDVVGACIGFELLGVERFSCSALHVGSGMVEMAHGRFPVPPPAVAELLKRAPIYSTGIAGELVTPTGAAIISTVCEEFGKMPPMRVEQTGYGAGMREYERFPNVLRVLVGETEGAAEYEKLLMVETNLDDASPQLVGFVMERAFESGALDCYFTPVQMKKNRPGVLVSILCELRRREKMFELLFAETPTLGVRCYEVERRALEREIVTVETVYGRIDVKVARMNGQVKGYTPEYDRCREAATRANVPLRTVEEAARTAFARLLEMQERN
ncbi:MAG TPA: nickel pincer cofactor biosynthesis protein LarC [Pyrinomonadaceae bacterium]|jgi:hypothetical protein